MTKKTVNAGVLTCAVVQIKAWFIHHISAVLNSMN